MFEACELAAGSFEIEPGKKFPSAVGDILAHASREYNYFVTARRLFYQINEITIPTKIPNRKIQVERKKYLQFMFTKTEFLERGRVLQIIPLITRRCKLAILLI